jgi:hypothetical protein
MTEIEDNRFQDFGIVISLRHDSLISKMEMGFLQ